MAEKENMPAKNVGLEMEGLVRRTATASPGAAGEEDEEDREKS